MSAPSLPRRATNLRPRAGRARPPHLGDPAPARPVRARLPVALLALAAVLAACRPAPQASAPDPDATPATVQANQAFARDLKLDDPRDLEDARRGLVARPSGRILAQDGRVLVDFAEWDFIRGEAPPTVNPSLWRHAVLNAQAGLFKVAEGIHQLRGFDIANMTLIDGRSGWIVVDPLTAKEAAATAIAFARQHLGNKPVSAVIFTHSHGDHFGGVLGVVSAKEVAERRIPVIAPEGFIEEATSENVLAGIAMGRRSRYQFGGDLPRSATGNVDTGLGKTLVYGTVGILPPTHLVSRGDEPMTVDGVRVVFHNTPASEAPAEMTFSLPDHKAWCGAEIATQTMHNLLPLRGAKVRDALRWSGYLQQALDQLGDTEVYFASHTWPLWGRERIAGFLTAQRDVYKYMHDQTVRLLNKGLTPREISATIRLPASLGRELGARGYYGDLRHNAKAVYQFYLGHYDGNPANLDPLPPAESSARYLALMGGADKVVESAQQAFDQGEYRWVVELLNHVAFAQPGHASARTLLARAYDQLGYQAESATWRNSYLTAAQEVRDGPPKRALSRAMLIDMLRATPTPRFLEALAASLDGPAAADSSLRINLVLREPDERFALWLEHGVLHFREGAQDPDANATLTLTKDLFLRMMVGTGSAKDVLLGDDLSVEGSKVDLVRFLTLLDKIPGDFAIVTR
jgi:alkyl sulfatase BDS1-like metallo-beta-lactamase superfamily hydrolase